ncbi:helix-turn-helix domain-containing protein [Leisingera sp. NJS204]|uniref:helix-turn-helix domain-containing protein n=1 Tax=Leisingera sp. NJS204 TaxID=2508307 RepID=UPI0020C82292|nr:AraC family transcriptional regulator [Leisingera sp. NJS204]
MGTLRMLQRANQTIAAHCADNTLLIPNGLFDFEDAQPVIAQRGASIFRKFIRKDMLGVEFFTNAACLAYVVRGQETFYDFDGGATCVSAGDMLMIPRHHHMISDFTNADGPLEAWLFFFDDPVIDDFLKATSAVSTQHATCMPSLFAGTPCLKAYVAALPQVYVGLDAPYALVKAKLLELLLLLDLHDDQNQLRRFLLNTDRTKGRRNIKQLMRRYADRRLTVADYARLSGRSLSSFQRDFKRAFGIAPGAWLRDVKLAKGRELVEISTLSISEVAYEIGYADTSHFIKDFRRAFGETPKQMRLKLA